MVQPRGCREHDFSQIFQPKFFSQIPVAVPAQTNYSKTLSRCFYLKLTVSVQKTVHLKVAYISTNSLFFVLSYISVVMSVSGRAAL